MKPDRQTARKDFLNGLGLGSMEIQPFAADASFRRYFRLIGSTPAQLLMDAPPPQEDIDPFVRLAQHLRTIGLRTPKIYATDQPRGFVLLEDFGDRTFTRLLMQRAVVDDKLEQELYTLAADVLMKLHHHPQAQQVAVARYDINSLVDEASLFSEWFVPSITGRDTGDDGRREWRQAWHDCLSRLPPLDDTLVLRDFHVDNLMIVDNPDSSPRTPEGTQRCGLLDFQDAVIGSPAYDFVSLLEDARRDVSPQVKDFIKKYYNEHCRLVDNPQQSASFWRHYQTLGAQRHAKVAGIFVRLFARDGKDVYLKHLPRVLRLFQDNIRAEADVNDDFAEVRGWLTHYVAPYCEGLDDPSDPQLPAPHPTRLQHLQATARVQI